MGGHAVSGKLDDERRDRAAPDNRSSARRQAQLNLLDVARITSGKLRLKRTIIELKDVVFDALQIMVQPGADAKGVRIVCRYAAPIDPLWDAVRLQQVICCRTR